jgi:hypothetical protein
VSYLPSPLDVDSDSVGPRPLVPPLVSILRWHLLAAGSNGAHSCDGRYANTTRVGVNGQPTGHQCAITVGWSRHSLGAIPSSTSCNVVVSTSHQTAFAYAATPTIVQVVNHVLQLRVHCSHSSRLGRLAPRLLIDPPRNSCGRSPRT